MSKLRTPWIEPVSVKPEHFVNRTKDRARLRALLEAHIAYKTRGALVLIGGERGIGKSIFARTVLAEVGQSFPDDVITVVVPARSKSLINIMREYAKELVKAGRSMAKRREWPTTWGERWLNPLQELAFNEQITRQASALVAREVGADGELSAGLWTVLQGKSGFQWSERREQGQVTEHSLTVTPTLLAEAINVVLAELAERLTVLVFFDDLDQASGMDTAERAKDTFDLVLGLGPAIHLIHLRSEVKFPDVRREHDDPLTLGGLDADELNELLRRRADATLEEDRRLVRSDAGWAPLRRLCASTGNPLVLLRWVKALADLVDHWPPPEDWMSPTRLRALALQAAAMDELNDDDVRRLGLTLDRLGEVFTETELLAGRRATDTRPGEPLTPTFLAQLRHHELIVPVDRFDPSRGLRIDPIISLIRPSRAEMIRSYR
ncbi:AAA family ATPase [Myxococcota bacterium]|nr:AAA family ATPase [Myxococcota bacterium]